MGSLHFLHVDDYQQEGAQLHPKFVHRPEPETPPKNGRKSATLS